MKGVVQFSSVERPFPGGAEESNFPWLQRPRQQAVSVLGSTAFSTALPADAASIFLRAMRASPLFPNLCPLMQGVDRGAPRVNELHERPPPTASPCAVLRTLGSVQRQGPNALQAPLRNFIKECYLC